MHRFRLWLARLICPASHHIQKHRRPGSAYKTPAVVASPFCPPGSAFVVPSGLAAQLGRVDLSQVSGTPAIPPARAE